VVLALVRIIGSIGKDDRPDYRSLDRATYNQNSSTQNQFDSSPSSENPLDPANLDFRKLNGREFNRANQDCSGSLKVRQSNGQQGNCISTAPIADIYAFPKERMERIWAIQRDAASGESEAQYKLGMEFLSGQSALSRDPRKGYEWLRRAADQEHILAREALGIAYYKGDVGSLDDKLAVELLTFAADRDRADAKYWLAHAYTNGRGVEKDTRLAAQLIGEAAALGSTDAALVKKSGQFSSHSEAPRNAEVSRDVGSRRIVPPSIGGSSRRDDAVAYLHARAVTGNADATYQLALEYLSGKRVQKDYERANQWFEKLAEKNPPVAKFWQSQLYQKGLGVPQDKVRGRALLTGAKLQANPKIVKDFAWQMATHPNKELRNGHLAVELMEHELQDPANNNLLMLNTLAAAYASIGNFEKAVQTQKSAMELLAAAGNGDRSELESRLILYRNSEAYVEQ
jgi:TPR repeat protein